MKVPDSSATEAGSTTEARDLEVELSARELPRQVAEIRKVAAERDALLEEVVRPRIEGVIGTCRSLVRTSLRTHAPRPSGCFRVAVSACSRF
jgi:hypothetical protein